MAHVMFFGKRLASFWVHLRRGLAVAQEVELAASALAFRTVIVLAPLVILASSLSIYFLGEEFIVPALQYVPEVLRTPLLEVYEASHAYAFEAGMISVFLGYVLMMGWWRTWWQVTARLIRPFRQRAVPVWGQALFPALFLLMLWIVPSVPSLVAITGFSDMWSTLSLYLLVWVSTGLLYWCSAPRIVRRRWVGWVYGVVWSAGVAIVITGLWWLFPLYVRWSLTWQVYGSASWLVIFLVFTYLSLWVVLLGFRLWILQLWRVRQARQRQRTNQADSAQVQYAWQSPAGQALPSESEPDPDPHSSSTT